MAWCTILVPGIGTAGNPAAVNGLRYARNTLQGN